MSEDDAMGPDGSEAEAGLQRGPDWSGCVRGVDLVRVRRLRRRRFRETVRAIGRQERQRVVPLPLALGAILLPFLAAWAAAAPPPRVGAAAASGPGASTDLAAPTSSNPAPSQRWPRPPVALARERRAPADPGGYVDVWGAPEPWEQRLVER